jgi:hypothetical protein
VQQAAASGLHQLRKSAVSGCTTGTPLASASSTGEPLGSR